MARGKISLKETVPDNEIVRLGEVRNKPELPLSDGVYGISGGYKDYSLVKKRIAYRTGTDDDGENKGKVIEYETWDDVPCYNSTMVGMFKSYAKILNLTSFKEKKLINGLSGLIEIVEKTDKTINDSLKIFDRRLNKEQEEVCKLLDVKESLLNEIQELREIKNTYKNTLEGLSKLDKEIKDKRRIVVQEMPKQKKHRLKLETE